MDPQVALEHLEKQNHVNDDGQRDESHQRSPNGAENDPAQDQNEECHPNVAPVQLPRTESRNQKADEQEQGENHNAKTVVFAGWDVKRCLAVGRDQNLPACLFAFPPSTDVGSGLLD